MKYFVKKSHFRETFKKTQLKIDCGWGNGYVIIPKNHPWWNKPYEDLNNEIYVHFGLTYGQIVTPSIIMSFNTKELNDSHIGMYLIGFDTGHYTDTLKLWPKKRVIEETQYLEKQVRNLGYRKFID